MRFLIGTIAIAILLFGPFSDAAPTLEELREKIEDRNQKIKALEEEISVHQKELGETEREAKSLQHAVRNLELTRRKLLADLKVTENRLQATALTIEEFSGKIREKEQEISRYSTVLAESLRRMNEAGLQSLLEIMLSYERLSSFTDIIETLSRFEDQLGTVLEDLKVIKAGLESDRQEMERRRHELEALKGELSDRRSIIEYNRKEKNSLLTLTKNRESDYKRILQEKFSLRDAFERELLEFEARLRFEVDPTSFPGAGTRVLSWPLDAVTITQHFGDTSFARGNPRAYGGKGHNGIDLRVSVGTPVKVALRGRVVGGGDTDQSCRGASYGKWVLIEHGNGLSTLYAHLSLVKVHVGDEVFTGEVIGYSGATGYATGPHLHFTVYATQGVRIITRKSRVCGGSYTIPVADLKAYLNPVLYL